MALLLISLLHHLCFIIIKIIIVYCITIAVLLFNSSHAYLTVSLKTRIVYTTFNFEDYNIYIFDRACLFKSKFQVLKIEFTQVRITCDQ